MPHLLGQLTPEELDGIFDSAYNAIIVIDNRGLIKVFNRAAEKLVGIKAEDALGKPMEEVIPGSLLLDVLHTGKPIYNHRHYLGNIPCLSNRTPIIREGAIVGAVSIFQDISALEEAVRELALVKEKNKELDAILEASYDGIWISDGEGNTLRVNKGYERFSGIKREEVVGKNLRDLVRQGYYSDSAALHVLETKQPVTLIHDIITGKRAMVTATPVFDDQGNIWRIVTNVRDISEIIRLNEELSRARERAASYAAEVKRLQLLQGKTRDIVVHSKVMQKVFEVALKVAAVDSTVLILGESGVGKDVVAGFIHETSRRSAGPYIKVNCGAIPETLVESELFGYERGSFTGASREGKAGMFELANGGTIFLDEVAELPLNIQVKLLQAIQDGRIYRVGGTKPVKLDIRVIAATNRDLEKMVREGAFREDLYYRLNVVPIIVPPLRERKEEIPFLVNHFVEKFNKKYGTRYRFHSQAVELLMDYSWPGNVRELENLVERLLVLAEGEEIRPEHLPSYLQKPSPNREIVVNTIIPLRRALEETERQLFALAFARYGTTRKVARALEIDQSTVVRKWQKYRNDVTSST
ncbi:MAG: hypothetical protein PWP65_700 [Clostridia bacterium]|nr:hypothetical protein [Clostridia bacterium]